LRRAPAAILAALAAALTLSLLLYPDASLQAAKSGLNLFLTVVFPSLLPFFILSEIMLGLGVVHFIGVLFEPLMRPVFNVPGEGAFALSMGLAAGYPMDAVIAARFRKLNLCNRVEGERLLAFTNTADPLFIFGAVAVGMFGMPALGAVLALAHYVSALGVGLIFRFYGRRVPSSGEEKPRTGHILVRAGRALFAAREEDGRPLGRLAGDAVNDSVKTLLMICGFIMLFSVFVGISGRIGLAQWLGWPFLVLFRGLGLEPSLVNSVVSGFFEIDLGTVAASQAVAPFVQKALMASAVIAWSGLSVHGQVASVITGTDIRMGPYVVARLAHAVLAALATVVLVPLLLGPTAAAVGGLTGPGDAGPLAGLGAALRAAAAWRGVAGPGFVWWSLGRGALLAAAVPLGLALAGAVAGLVGGRVARVTGRDGRGPRSRPRPR
jgi:sporulation integral membrane protein YlbJ